MAMSSCERKRLQRASEKGYAKSRECDWRKQGIINASYVKYLEMIVEQHSMCAVTSCSHMIDTTSPLDHDHATGLVRSVLCQQCNLTVGQVENGRYNAAYLRGIASYIDCHTQV